MQANYMVLLVRRPENRPVPESELKQFYCINSFEEINFRLDPSA